MGNGTKGFLIPIDRYPLRYHYELMIISETGNVHSGKRYNRNQILSLSLPESAIITSDVKHYVIDNIFIFDDKILSPMKEEAIEYRKNILGTEFYNDKYFTIIYKDKITYEFIYRTINSWSMLINIYNLSEECYMLVAETKVWLNLKDAFPFFNRYSKRY